jgi:DNA-binding transcriptional ArsR family regulator
MEKSHIESLSISIPVLKQEIAATSALAELRGYLSGCSDPIPYTSILKLMAALDASGPEMGPLTLSDIFLAETIEADKYKAPRAMEVQHFNRAIDSCQHRIDRVGQLDIDGFKELEALFSIAGIQSETGEADSGESDEAIAAWVCHWNECEGNLRDLAILHYQFLRDASRIPQVNWLVHCLDQIFLKTKGHVGYPVVGLGRLLDNRKQQYGREVFGDDIESWTVFYLKALEDSAKASLAVIHAIESFKNELDEKLQNSLPKLQKQGLARLLILRPFVKSAVIEESFGLERKAAARHLQALEHAGILRAEKLGRETLYGNFRLIELLQDLQEGWK